jgi:hypothetical protein
LFVILQLGVVVVRLSVQLLVRIVVVVPGMYWEQPEQPEQPEQAGQVEREREVLVVKPSVQPS